MTFSSSSPPPLVGGGWGKGPSAPHPPAPTRRRLLAAAATALAAPRIARAQSARLVVVGGGFGGAAAARALRRHGLDVTLVAPGQHFLACPLSNLVVAGLRDLDSQSFGYGRLDAEGIRRLPRSATAIDAQARRITLDDGSTVPYDRAVLSPGIEMIWGAVSGYDQAAARRMPHAWQAGPQTQLLRQQLQAVPEGGLVVVAVPAAPYRCPPAPYERISLIAYALRDRSAKIMVLDSKDDFSHRTQFRTAWESLYPGMIEWVGLSQGGNVVAVDPEAMTVSTDFDQYSPAVANIIPPQRAGALARIAGIADRTGWCPIDPVTFESPLRPMLHVIGDAVLGGQLPKSASGAVAQAQACADAIAALLAGRRPAAPRLATSCYALIAPDEAIPILGEYTVADGTYVELPAKPGQDRLVPAAQGEAWFHDVTQAAFG